MYELAIQLNEIHPAFVLSVPLALTVVASYFDLESREIPDWIAMAILAWSLIVSMMGMSGASWEHMLAGFLVASGVSLVGYFLHFGGGDVKLVASLGAAIGAIGGVVSVLLFVIAVGIAGTLVAVIMLARGQRTLPYAPAIAAGLAVCTAAISLAAASN